MSPEKTRRAIPHLGRLEFIIVAAFLLCLLFFSIAYGRADENGLLQLDQSLLESIHGSAPQGLEPLMSAITFLGSPAFLGGLVLVSLALLVWRKRWRSARLVFAVGLLTPMSIEGLKIVFHRTRPELWPRLPDASYSYPSGHALGSLVVYGVLAYLACQAYPRWRNAFLAGCAVLVALIGFSRLYLGLHWPTDVLGSWVSGSLLLFGLVYWHKQPTSSGVERNFRRSLRDDKQVKSKEG